MCELLTEKNGNNNNNVYQELSGTSTDRPVLLAPNYAHKYTKPWYVD